MWRATRCALSWTDTHAFLSMVRALLQVHAMTLEIHDAGLGLPESNL